MRDWRRFSIPLLLAAVLTLVSPGICLGFEAAVDGLAKNLGDRLEVAGKKTVAVVDFTDVSGGHTELGRFLAEELSVALLASPRDFQVVDRAHLSRILEEMELGESGIMNPETAKEVGRIAGVDALITGTLTSLDTTVRLTVKVLETETANIIAGDRASIPATGTTRELLARGLVGQRHNAPTAVTASPHTEAYNIESHEAGGIRATIRSVRLLKDNRLASLIVLQNNNSYPVRVGIPGWANNGSQALDNHGNLFQQRTGLEGTFGCDDDDGLTIAPGESQQITEIYTRESREGTNGRIFQVTLSLKVCRPQDKQSNDGKQIQFSFSDLKADPVPKGQI